MDLMKLGIMRLMEYGKTARAKVNKIAEMSIC